jgi:ComF family protein
MQPALRFGDFGLGLAGQCELCRGWSARALCDDCTLRHAAQSPRCTRCGLRLASAAPVCGGCLRQPPPFDGCISAHDYAFPWDRLIADLKFHGRVDLAPVLARQLCAAVRRRGGTLPDLVAPIPLAPRRLTERGFNQAWELARCVAAALGCASEARLLARPLDGLHQADLSLAQRRTNLRGAFVVEPSRRSRLRGRHIALVDDVMTSGTTVGEAAAALRRAGAARVDVWVLARTPAPGG